MKRNLLILAAVLLAGYEAPTVVRDILGTKSWIEFSNFPAPVIEFHHRSFWFAPEKKYRILQGKLEPNDDFIQWLIEGHSLAQGRESAYFVIRLPGYGRAEHKD